MKTKNPVRFILSIAVLLLIIIGWNNTSANSSNLQKGDSILHVKPGEDGDCSSWDDACNLQFALSVAETGDQVWVAAGTYKPTTDTDRLATFQLESGVAIYGGFAGTETNLAERDWETNLSILSGDLGTEGDNADNSYHVVTGTGVDETAILDGFTIIAGNANGGTPHSVGGGMYNLSGSPTLINVTFSNNLANYGGGGVYNYASSPTLNNVTFSSNTATQRGGGMYNEYSSSPTLTNVTFSSNSADSSAGSGGGMHNFESSNPTLFNVTFSSNSARDGGGMLNLFTSSPTLTNVTFSGNTANSSGGGIYTSVNSNPNLTNVIFSSNNANDGAGGMFTYHSSPTLTNVTFSNNTAFNSGGMGNSESSPTLTNVTFSGNTATQYGGGMGNYYFSGTMTHVTFSGNTAGISGGAMRSERSSPTITNSIFWGNGLNQLDFIIHSYPVVSYSVIEGGFTGGTNIITDDPLLGDLADNGGFTQTHALGAESLAIDAADPASCPAFDQRYYFRPIDGDESGSAACDIGAYEYGSYELEFSLAVDEVGEGTVTIDPFEDTYHFGDMVTLTATASPGWSFSGWSGDASGTLNPLTITIEGDTSITASFTQDEYTLTVAVEPLEKGSVSIDPVEDTYLHGDEVTLTPIAIPGWYFTGWSGDASGTDNPLTITIEGDTNITANFLEYFEIYLPLILKN